MNKNINPYIGKIKFKLYDESLSRIDTPQGTMTLISVFIPFFIEMLLLRTFSLA